MTEWIEEIRARYAHYGPTDKLKPNTAVLHIRLLLDEIDNREKVAYRAGREDTARALAGLPIEAVRALCVLWDTWWNKVDAYDPGRVLICDGTPLTGIASLMGSEGSAAMEEACDAVEPYESAIAAFLARGDGVQPTEEQRAWEEDQERDEKERS